MRYSRGCLLRSLPLLVLVILLNGCGIDAVSGVIEQESDSDDDHGDEFMLGRTSTAWGHLRGGQSFWLAQEKPGREIRVCGNSHVAEVVEGLQAWAKVVGRERGLTFVSSCATDGSESSEGVRMIYVLDRTHRDAISTCARYPKAAALTFVDHSLILMCDESNKITEVMLHEAGHLWGLCDVYPDSVTGQSNCDERYFTGRSRGTVMGANYERQLARGDVDGIKALVARRDLRGNRLWANSADLRVTSPMVSAGVAGAIFDPQSIELPKDVEPTCRL